MSLCHPSLTLMARPHFIRARFGLPRLARDPGQWLVGGRRWRQFAAGKNAFFFQILFSSFFETCTMLFGFFFSFYSQVIPYFSLIEEQEEIGRGFIFRLQWDI
jgi:hypothetical protein